MLPEITRDFVYASTVALHRMRHPGVCLDYDLVTRRAIPSEAALEATLEARRMYVRGTIRERMARWDEARTLYEQARDRAAEVGADHIEAAAYAGLGAVAEGEGDLAGARRELETAFEIAAGAGADSEAAAAAAKLAQLIGLKTGHPRAGLAWGELSGAYYDQAGFPEDHPRRVRLLENIATVRLQLAHEPALTMLERVYDLTVAEHGEGHSEPARVLNNLANAYVQSGRYDEAETAYERVVAQQRLLFGPRHPFVADATYNLGLTLRAKGELDDAYLYLESALTLRKEILPPDHPALAISYIGMAQLEGARRNYDAVIKAVDRADAILEKQPPTMERAIALAVGANELIDDRTKLARRYAERAVDVLRELDPSGLRALGIEMHGVLAVIEAADGDVDRALVTARRALDDAVARGASPGALGQCYAALAEVHYAARLYPDARRYAELGAQHDPAASGVLGEVMLREGDARGAIARIEPALERFGGDPIHRRAVEALRVTLARAHVAKGDLDEAGAILDEIADRSVHGMSERLATNVDVVWAEIHHRRGEFDSARRRFDRVAGRTTRVDDPATIDALEKLTAELEQ